MKVSIKVFDVNDNSPVFTRDLYSRKVVENVAVGTTVEVLRANDDDAGRNGDVRYKIVTGNEAGNVSYNLRSRHWCLIRKDSKGKARKQHLRKGARPMWVKIAPHI